MMLEMGRVYKCGLMVLGTKDSGQMIKQMAMVNLDMQMAMCMKVIGIMIRLMAKEFILMPTALPMKVTGMKISSMVSVKRAGLTEQFTKDIILKARSMGKEC